MIPLAPYRKPGIKSTRNSLDNLLNDSSVLGIGCLVFSPDSESRRSSPQEMSIAHSLDVSSYSWRDKKDLTLVVRKGKYDQHDQILTQVGGETR